MGEISHFALPRVVTRWWGMSSDPRAIAFNPAAPDAERNDAMAELARIYRAPPSDLLPADVFWQVAHDVEMLKASNVLAFPVDRVRQPGERPPREGTQSVHLDEMQVAMQGEYYEPPTLLTPEVARRMVDQTPILSAIIMTRQRQVARFCTPSEDGGLGFAIRHVDASHQLTESEEETVRNLTRFVQHCGWEFSPRKRKALGRRSFATTVAMMVRETLTLDAMPIEVEWKRDKSLGISGFYALDGSSIRLTVPGKGFRGNPDIYALQVVNGRIETAYPADSLIFEARNPRADVRFGDYGWSELEVLIQTITGFLNAMALNLAGFNKNSIPKGILHLFGQYSQEELVAFKRYMQTMMRGPEGAFQLPILVSPDNQGKAQFEKFGVEFNEIMFAKWMTFLSAMATAVYGMDPNEINFESFSNGPSSLSGSDTQEKLTASKDKGLRPLLSYLEATLSDWLIGDAGDQWCLRWIGLDPKDAQQEHELRKLTLTVDEVRARLGEKAHEDPIIGSAPVNPALMALYQQQVQPQGEDFGGGGGDFGDPGEGGAPPGDQDGGGEPGMGDDGEEPPDDAERPPPAPGEPGAPEDFGKALPPIYTVGG